VHSEYNFTKDPLTFYQIWIETNKTNVKPHWESKQFDTTPSAELPLLVSGYDEDNALFINQAARIYGGKLSKGTTIEHSIKHQGYILASDGMFEIEVGSVNIAMNKGDGAEVTQSSTVILKALINCEIFIIDTIA
jgi:redox-sensitive bicupin YhaK (pirin superfamily)